MAPREVAERHSGLYRGDGLPLRQQEAVLKRRHSPPDPLVERLAMTARFGKAGGLLEQRDIFAHLLDPAMLQPRARLHQHQPLAARRPQNILDVPMTVKTAAGSVGDARRTVARAMVKDDHVADQPLDCTGD
ncbi:hypothetical protein D3C87_1599370 [compost metagenome]